MRIGCRMVIRIGRIVLFCVMRAMRMCVTRAGWFVLCGNDKDAGVVLRLWRVVLGRGVRILCILQLPTML